MLGPVKTVSGLAAEPKTSGELAMGGALGRRSTLPSTRMSPRCWSLPRARFGVATFSFDSPSAFRELEVYGTKAVIRLPDPGPGLMSPSCFTRRT
jgi:hypothetical protein